MQKNINNQYKKNPRDKNNVNRRKISNSIVKQVDDIEAKLDQLIELYMEDRKRLLALPMSEPEPSLGGDGNGNGGPPGTPMSATSFVLKPILVDKQLSEPSSPTTCDSERSGHLTGKPRQMHRGHSDLGSRIADRVKKRVTLRYNKFFFFFSCYFLN